MDVKTAFLNGDLEEEIYMDQPEGCVVPGRRKRCKLVKSLYGLKQAPKQWHNKFDHVLVTNGYSINDADKCIYSKYEDNTCVVICLYVDDMLIFGTSLEVVCETKKFLGSKFDMKDLGEAELTVKKNREHSVAQIEYAQIIGSLMYLMNCTNLTLLMHVLEGFSDANWISDSDEMKSTSGYVFILGGSAVSWKLPSKLHYSVYYGAPSVSMRCDSQTAIAKAKSKIFNGKNKHIRLRHNIVNILDGFTYMRVEVGSSYENLGRFSRALMNIQAGRMTYLCQPVLYNS
ncbi:Retrovirus-related Pol polyprotein from transposon TNT 1-94 [Vitis vinifera]|uniref:Retrovirus-related Pol polyprotein from transposon TNT 1-94 n=1 Tax=Vitis vinifera TaxID=29760 RepID=A0A438FTT0_VITVI|nr:Retrovirus-related Pol polyprotein from transposon TNT 1-94 [Vitis vinifera]